MTRAAGLGLALLLVGLLPGCASVRTLDAAKPGAPIIYAGTRLDWYVLHGGCCPLDRFGAEAPTYAGLDLPVSYHHEAEEALDDARRRGATALLLPAPGLDEVLSVVRQGRLLPEKATSFQPKPHVGSLMRSVAGG